MTTGYAAPDHTPGLEERGGYRDVLATPAARRLLASTLTARLPQGMSLAVLLLVRDATGSFAAAGAVVGALGLATALCAPLLGRRIDRHGPRRLLLTYGVQQAAVYLAIVLAASWWDAPVPVLVVLGALAGARQPPVAACARVLWPTVVRGRRARETAFALDATTQDAIWVVGPLIVGAIIAFASPVVAVCLMSAVTVGGVLWFASGPALRAWPAWASGGERPDHLLRSSAFRGLLAGTLVAGLSMGAIEVGLPGLADDLSRPGTAGTLVAVAALGSVVCGFAFGLRRWRGAVELRLAWALAVAAITALPLLLPGDVGVAIALALFSGAAWAPTLTCVYALVERLAPATAITEAFTWSSAATGGGIALGAATAGALVDVRGSAAAFAFAAGASAVACAIIVWGRPRLRVASEA